MDFDSRPGSMADVPKDLLSEIKNLEEMFTVPKERLDKIVTKFVKELEKGLANEGSTIVSTSPTGSLERDR